MAAVPAPITVTLIHATPAAMPPIFSALDVLPELRLLNILDEALLTEVERHGSVTQECLERMATQLGLAAAAGSAAVLVTCNTYSAAIAGLRPRFTAMPIVAIDEPMVKRAVAIGSRIGVIATVAAGLREHTDLIARVADLAGRRVEVTSVLREDAFAALAAGDQERHDEIIIDELPRLAAAVDVVLLAQASMARLMDKVPAGLGVPVLASPPLAVDALAHALGLTPRSTVRRLRCRYRKTEE